MIVFICSGFVIFTSDISYTGWKCSEAVHTPTHGWWSGWDGASDDGFSFPIFTFLFYLFIYFFFYIGRVVIG